MSHKVPSQKEKYEMPLQNTAIDLCCCKIAFMTLQLPLRHLSMVKG